MSYTEIFGFKKNGEVEEVGEIRNAWRGAMAVWTTLEKRYLPKYIPVWATDTTEEYSRMSGMGDEKIMQEVWDIAKLPEITEVDKIAMKSTFDKVIVKRENFGKLIEAFEAFKGETSLKEQAALIKDLDDDVIAIGWNQSSVNGDTWMNFGGYTEETEEGDSEPIPYSLKTGTKHWELFDKEN